MRISELLVAGFGIVAATASAFHTRRAIPATTTGYNTEYWFDQLIDHSNPSLGTFKQRYYFSDEFWQQNGDPIIMNTPGEQSAEGFYTELTGYSLQRSLMNVFGAAGVVLEHRYWGKSSPYADLTTANLKYLSVAQAIEDYKYFAENVQLPWTKAINSSHPSATPWINIGCSYPGLLVAYTQETYPDLFAAGWSTSAPLQADGDYWEYWEPIEEGMPQNCSADLGVAMAYMDNLMSTGTPDEIIAMKAKFGLEGLENDDFGALLQYPLNTWQNLQAYDFANSGTSLFHKFCDSIETLPTGQINTAATGVGMPQALENWGAAFKKLGPDQDCPGTGGVCYSSKNYQAAIYTNTTNDDAYNRGWLWLLCTELGWFQIGDPDNHSSIVSKQVTTSYTMNRCAHTFPNADGTPGSYSPTTSAINSEYQGWNLMAKHLFAVNGEYDPWRSASISSRWAPTYVDTPTQEITVIPKAHHCWDFYLANTVVNTDVEAAQTLGVREIQGWLQNWYNAHPSVPNRLTTAAVTAGGAGGFVTATTANVTMNGTTNVDDDDDDDDDDDLDEKIKGQVNSILANRGVTIASFVLNAVLLLGLIAVLIAWIITRRKQIKASPGVLPSWGYSEGDKLGEYGSGSRAGGRGAYQTLKEQH